MVNLLETDDVLPLFANTKYHKRNDGTFIANKTFDEICKYNKVEHLKCYTGDG